MCVSRVIQEIVRTVLDGLLRVEAMDGQLRGSPSTAARWSNSRSLLASETLEENLGVAVDAQVLDGL